MGLSVSARGLLKNLPFCNFKLGTLFHFGEYFNTWTLNIWFYLFRFLMAGHRIIFTDNEIKMTDNNPPWRVTNQHTRDTFPQVIFLPKQFFFRGRWLFLPEANYSKWDTLGEGGREVEAIPPSSPCRWGEGVTQWQLGKSMPVWFLCSK